MGKATTLLLLFRADHADLIAEFRALLCEWVDVET
jgi:hypothetical protein